MKCYKCKFRGSVPGSAHSSCNVIKQTSNQDSAAKLELLLAAGGVQLTDQNNEPIVKLDPHGVKNGWAMWPLNFDPVWVQDCKFFTEKETLN